MERYVYLLDGLVICCKMVRMVGMRTTWSRRLLIEYLTEKKWQQHWISCEREAKHKEKNGAHRPWRHWWYWTTGIYDCIHHKKHYISDLKLAFELTTEDQPSLIFFALSGPDKNEWMAAFTALLTRRYVSWLWHYWDYSCSVHIAHLNVCLMPSWEKKRNWSRC